MRFDETLLSAFSSNASNVTASDRCSTNMMSKMKRKKITEEKNECLENSRTY